MSIAPLSRVTVIGRRIDQDTLLMGLQELGCVHLTPMIVDQNQADLNLETSPEGGTAIANARKALRFISDAPYIRRQLLHENGFSWSQTVDAILDLKTRLRLAEDRYDFLSNRLAGFTAWGEIEFPEDGAPGGQFLWFYELPLREKAVLNDIDIPWCIVGTDRKIAYTVLISPEEPSPDLLPLPRLHFGSLPPKRLREEIRQTEIEIDDLVAERVASTRFIYLLGKHLHEAENDAALQAATSLCFLDEQLCSVQGWVPDDQLRQIETFADKRDLAVVISPPKLDDAPPTLLQQPETRQVGIDLSLFYQVPGYRSWDPSVLLLTSFTLFFAMILADAGYGLILAMGLAFYWRKLGTSLRGRSYRLFGVWLVTATIAYGVMVGSYFGISPSPGTWLAGLKLISVDNFDVMMRLSIGIGVTHIVIANLISAYAERGRLSVVAKFGWALAAIAGYGLYIGYGNDAVSLVSQTMFALSLVLIFLFSSDKRPSSLKDYLSRFLEGANALTGMMTAFGDVLSYMRLFALGLASASLAITFNQLASNASDTLPGLGLLAAILILLVGHALNFALGIISGVVHGLRLNYIEFFKYAFESEGYEFTAFAKKHQINQSDPRMSS